MNRLLSLFVVTALALVLVPTARGQIVEITSAERNIAVDADRMGPTSPHENSTTLGVFNRAVFDNSSVISATASAGQNSEITGSATGLRVSDSSGAHASGGTGTPPNGTDAINELFLDFTITAPIPFSLDVTSMIQDGAPTGASHDQGSSIRLSRNGVVLFAFGGTSTAPIGPAGGSQSGTLLPGVYNLSLETFVHNAGDATREVTLTVGVIPEPASISLLLVAAGGMLAMRRKR